MFVDKDRIPISDGAGNTVFIRSKLTFKVRNLIGAEAAIDPAQAVHVMYRETIIGWQGPAFKDERNRDIPCTPENIDNLDPDEPLVQQVADEINRRYATPDSPDPNAPTASGSTSTGGDGSTPSDEAATDESPTP